MLRGTTIQPLATQKNLMLLEKLYPGSLNNHRSVAVEIHGPIQLGAFKQALLHVTRRHEMLRAVVANPQAALSFQVLPEPDNIDDIPFFHWDASAFTSMPEVASLTDTLDSINKNVFIAAPFDLYKGPLWRCALIQFKPDAYQFVMLFNHIIVDEGSIGVIFKDLSTLYNGILTDGKVPSLETIPSHSTLTMELPFAEKERRLAFWKKKLEEFNPLTLQTDFPAKNAFQFNGSRLRFTLEQELIHPLEHHPKLQGMTLNQILLANLYALLYHYSGETDICLGITSSNRRYPGIDDKTTEKLVNCFFNSLPVRLSFQKSTTFTELAAQVKQALSEGLKNQLPPDLLLDEALTNDTKSGLRTATLFNILLVLNRKKPTLTLNETTASYPFELDLGRSKFPYFGINLDELENGAYQGFLEYNTDLFTEETIKRLLAHFKQSLRHIATHPECEIARIPLILEEEKALISRLNKTEKPAVIQAMLPDFLHQQATQTPDEIALVFHPETGSPERITYRELDEKTSQLANYLRTQGIRPHDNVGISLTRSSNLVIAMLAALKAGATLVTMETEASPMLNHKLESCRFAAIMIDQTTCQLFAKDKQPIINLDDQQTRSVIAAEPTTHTAPDITPDSPAYVMYTSGTSGEKPKPKGVVIAHRSLNNLINALADQRLKPHTKVIGTALPTFDAFLYDVLVALVTQGELHLCFAEGRYSPQVLSKIIEREQIQFGVFLPQLLSVLSPQLPLEYVISMGAAPDDEVMRLWAAAKPDRQLFNDLGHTETGIWLTQQRYQPGIDHTLIGQPIRNMQIFILNPDDLSLCPIGVEGEIYVAGPGLALGYLNNPDLTEDKFPSLTYDPLRGAFTKSDHVTENTIRLYATGDLACYRPLPTGELSIKFIGRKDREIKLNGIRVDLDEVEAILKSHPLVKNVTVVPNSAGTALNAFIVPQEAITLETLWSKIRAHLSTSLLPSVAYPSTYFAIHEMPLTPNGKINTRALPTQPELPTISSIPLTPMHTKLRKIWSKILALPEEQIGLTQSFRQLGGNSLQLAKMETLLNSERPQLGIPESDYIGINVLSNHMTITSLAESITPRFNIYLGPNTYQHRDGTIFFFQRNRTPEHMRPTAQPTPGAGSTGDDTPTLLQANKLH